MLDMEQIEILEQIKEESLKIPVHTIPEKPFDQDLENLSKLSISELNKYFNS